MKNNKFWDKRAEKDQTNVNLDDEYLYNKTIDLVRENLNPGSRIVDLGCGTGVIDYAISDVTKSIIGIDYSEGMINIANSKKRSPEHDHLNFQIGNITYTGIKEHSKDACLVCNLIPYIEDPDVVLSEAKRIVHPNGIVIVSSDCYGSIRSFRGIINIILIMIARFINIIPYTHFYTFRQMRQILENSGMVIIVESKVKHQGTVSLFTVLKT